MQPILIPKSEVCRLLCVSPDTVERLVRDGRLKPCRIGRLVRFKVEEINAFVQSNQQ